MTPTTQALLFGVIFLSGLEAAVLGQRGHCSGNLCFFQVSDEFQGAKKACEDSGGQLVAFKSEDEITTLTDLLSGLSGRYWLRNTDRTRKEAAEGLQNCPAVSVTTGQNVTQSWAPCRDKLNGFLCGFDGVCSLLQAEDTQVTYTALKNFEIVNSETLPPGTTAVVGKAGSTHPDSVHLCFFTMWIRAPWKCEVQRGGCNHNCSSATTTCTCPAGHVLHPNNITCTRHPCPDCAQGCQKQGDMCQCDPGYTVAPDGNSCVEENGCADLCTAEGEECVNIQGNFECTCKEGFLEEDGVCVNVTICELCEHMDCQKFSGVYQCVCRKGFRVSPKDPTKCEQHCTERDCVARCIPNPVLKKRDMLQCSCPDGYVLDIRNGTYFCTDINECEDKKMCDHKCENVYGGYRCLCNEGYKLEGEDKCVPLEEEEEEDGSGSTPLYFRSAVTPVSPHSVSLPPYIKTGSVLGITVFLVLCVVLLYFLVRNASKRCGRFKLSTFKHPDIDIFYLQQVTTETYKRLSFDKQLKNDSQTL